MSDMPEDLDAMFRRPQGETVSERHPYLAALGGCAVIFGVLTTAAWGALISLTGWSYTPWLWAPVVVGLLLFVLTALVAVTIDKGRGR